jgi:hypothetical protein
MDGPPRSPPLDVVLLQGTTEDGAGVRIVRAREDRIEAGEVRPLVEGKPLVSGEIVKLAPRKDMPQVCDVEVLAKVGAAEKADDSTPTHGHGPAQVATAAYRESWERVFGRAAEPSALN